MTLISFWHFTIVRQQPLTPSTAFTSILGDWLINWLRAWCSDQHYFFLCSFLRDEVCAQYFTWNFHRHASGMFSLLLLTYMYSLHLFSASSPSVVLKSILTLPKWLLSHLSTSNPKPSHSNPVPWHGLKIPIRAAWPPRQRQLLKINLSWLTCH